MARKYTRKTKRGQTPIDVLKRAARALRQSGKLRQSAREFKVSKTTLKCFLDQMSIDEDTAKKSGTSVWMTGIAFFLQKWKKTSQTISNH